MSHLSDAQVKSFSFIVSKAHTLFTLKASLVNWNKHTSIADISTVMASANILMQELVTDRIIHQPLRTNELYRPQMRNFDPELRWTTLIGLLETSSKVLMCNLGKFTLEESSYTSWMVYFLFKFCEEKEIETYIEIQWTTRLLKICWKPLSLLVHAWHSTRYLEKMISPYN